MVIEIVSYGLLVFTIALICWILYDVYRLSYKLTTIVREDSDRLLELSQSLGNTPMEPSD